MSRHWEDLVGAVYNTREMGCEAKVGEGVSALQRGRLSTIPSPALWEGLWQGNLLCAWCGSLGHWGSWPEPLDLTSPAVTALQGHRAAWAQSPSVLRAAVEGREMCCMLLCIHLLLL